MELNNNQKAILNTLLYSDIFNYPLTEEELWRGLITEKQVSRDTISKSAISLSESIIFKNGYYCLRGKEKIINKRIGRISIMQQKLEKAILIAKYLAFIPTIKFAGISGRLAHMDADKNDDIDMVFITKKNTLWATRFLILAVLEILNVRRKNNDKHPKNKICPNLIIDESAISWPDEKHDLYTAHEIISIYPLINRGNMYQKFINKNKWIKIFYANSLAGFRQGARIEEPRSYFTIKAISSFLSKPPLEFILDKLQRLYMSKKRTSEYISSNLLAFHPKDYRPKILNDFALKRKKFGFTI